MKRILGLLLVLVMVLSLSLVAFAEDDAYANIEEIKLSYGELNPDDHPMGDVAYYFANKVSELSGGKMTVEVYTSGVLGSEKECMQAMQIGGGSVDMFRGNTVSLIDYGCNKLNLFGTPYTFRDREHLWSVLESEIGLSYLNEPVEVGSRIKALFYTEEGARHFFTTKEVTGMADFKGLKLRVPKTEVMSETVKALGIEPTPIDWAELYSSLQTGVVDGAEQPFAGYYNNKFYEVAPYYVLDGHTYSPGIVLMSEAVWNGLSEAQQAVINEASTLTQNFCKDNAARVDEETLAKIREVATVIEVANPQEWQDATAEVIAKYTVGLEDEMAAIKAK